MVCDPFVNPLATKGLVQDVKAPLSTEQPEVAVSLTVKATLTEVWLITLPDGVTL